MLAHPVAAARAVQTVKLLALFLAQRGDKPLVVHAPSYTDLPVRRHLAPLRPIDKACRAALPLSEVWGHVPRREGAPMPFHREKHPRDREQIVARVKPRAGNRCEWCQAPNGAVGFRHPFHGWKDSEWWALEPLSPMTNVRSLTAMARCLLGGPSGC